MTIYHDPITLTGRMPDRHSGPGDADAYDAKWGDLTPQERAAIERYEASRWAHASDVAARMTWWQLLDAVDDLDAIAAACEAQGHGDALRTVLAVHAQLVAASMTRADR